eukprot:400148-Rhodomonas_salina.4
MAARCQSGSTFCATPTQSPSPCIPHSQVISCSCSRRSTSASASASPRRLERIRAVWRCHDPARQPRLRIRVPGTIPTT